MRIQARDLLLHLKRGLNNLYCVFGEEPLQHKEAIEAIRAKAKSEGYTERAVFEITPHFDWAILLEDLNTGSLFSEKRLVECRLSENSIRKKEAELLIKLFDSAIDQNIILLLSAQKIDLKLQQSLWFTTLEQKGCVIPARPLTQTESLVWLKNRLAAAGFQASPDTLQILFDRTEGNLLAAAQTIEKCQLCVEPPLLTIDHINELTGLDARFTVFDLIDAVLAGSIERTSRLFSSLKNEGIDPILISWAIVREVRMVILILYKMHSEPKQMINFAEHGVWKRREPLLKTFINRSSVSKLQQILIQAKLCDDIIKGRRKGDAWILLFSICLTLTGAYHG